MSSYKNIDFSELFTILRENNISNKSIRKLKYAYFTKMKYAERKYRINRFKLHFDLIISPSYFELICYQVKLYNYFKMYIIIDKIKTSKPDYDFEIEIVKGYKMMNLLS